MHKIYLRDYYPPMDVVIYSATLIAFTLLGIFYLLNDFTVWHLSYFFLSAASLLKLLGALSITTIFSSFISAGQKGILIRTYFQPSRSYNWQSIQRVEVKPDRLIVEEVNKHQKKVYYFSSLSENDQQLTKLLRTIAPLEHRSKIG